MNTHTQNFNHLKCGWRALRALLLIVCATLTTITQAAESILWQENFDDGNGDNRWYADQGVWEIGSPTVGPETNSTGFRVHSGTICAATGLNGNYLAGQDSRIVRIASFTVPPTNQFPRLRFWHWFSLAGPYCPFNCDEGSYAYVEIKVGANSWQRISPIYKGGSSGVWTRPSIDLTPYAGQNVQVAFHVHSAAYTDVGWYIDDVAVVTGTPVLNNPENFELGLSDWYTESGTWQVGVPTSGPPTNALGRRAFSGTNCAATVLDGNHASGIDSRFVSPAFVVPGAITSPRLRFWDWFSLAGPYCPFNCDEGSYAYVEIKVGTNNWQQASPTYRGSSSGVWTRPSIDLTPYAGQNVQVAFHVHSAAYTDFGWYIDDVAVVTGTPVLNNPENFELGLSDWYTESGTWQVGVPTSGPPTNALGRRAFSGTNCAATVLDGNHASGIDSRFVSPAFVVPGAITSPRLRFWHWFSLAGPYCPFNCDEGSYAYVEIKVGTNNWQQASPTYRGSSSGVWTRPSIDLTPYAGQNVQVAFHVHSAAYTDVGWYIDDVAVVTGTPVLNNPENFELGLSDWYTESGTWQVGVPTSGPPTNALGRRAFSGTNCAATVLDGNHAGGIDSRFVSPAFVVPGAITSPRLRFWHWFSLAGPYCPFNCDEGSYAYVEIKVDTNNWQQASPTYRGSSSGVWTRPSIDLTPYAGQNVQVAFHVHSAAYTDVGWYIDDVAVVTGTPVLNNPENFELGLSDWYTESGTWQVGVPTSGPPTNALGRRAFSGTNCAATVLTGDYASGIDSRLVSPAFVVPPRATAPSLRFRHWYDFAGRYCPFNCDEGSYGYVEIRVGTNNWQPVSPQYSGQSGTWTFPFIDLKAFGGQKIQVAFHFHSARNTAPGWYVDDVRLVHDFALLLLDSPIVRTQNTACLSLGIAASSPASTVSFILQALPGHLSSLMLNTESCWTGNIAPQPNSLWLINLQNSCTNTSMGVQTIGSICFNAVSTQSAFVPLAVNDLVVTNQDASSPPAYPFGSRAIIIANEPLLEAWLEPNRRRMLTTYGKANTSYEIRQATNVITSSPWALGGTNTVPPSLSITTPVTGAFSNAPVLFLRANEK